MRRPLFHSVTCGHNWCVCACRGTLGRAKAGPWVCEVSPPCPSSAKCLRRSIQLTQFSLLQFDLTSTLLWITNRWGHICPIDGPWKLLISVSSTHNRKDPNNCTCNKPLRLAFILLHTKSLSTLKFTNLHICDCRNNSQPVTLRGGSLWILQGLQMWPNLKSMHFQTKWVCYTVVSCLTLSVHTAKHSAGLQNCYPSVVKGVVDEVKLAPNTLLMLQDTDLHREAHLGLQ